MNQTQGLGDDDDDGNNNNNNIDDDYAAFAPEDATAADGAATPLETIAEIMNEWEGETS